tara:strand:- start:301 stop:552 length:252 start_codon:yes stop_codon:yes gene_type:complete
MVAVMVVDPTLVVLVVLVVAVVWIGLRLPLEVLLLEEAQVTQVELVVTSRLGLMVQVAVVVQGAQVLIIQLLMVVMAVQGLLI